MKEDTYAKFGNMKDSIKKCLEMFKEYSNKEAEVNDAESLAQKN